MTDTTSHTPTPAIRKPIPITFEELLADWEANIDRVIVGDTLMLLTDGKPTHYLISLAEYEALKIKKEKAEELALLKAQETVAAKVWNNDADRIYDTQPDAMHGAPDEHE